MTVAQQMEADHEELDRLFDSAFASLVKADRAGTYRKLDLFWARLAMHIRAEHVCLFPEIERLSNSYAHADRSRSDDLAAVLAALRHDHDFFMRELASSVRALRIASDFGNEPETFLIVRQALERVAERLRTHNRIEEERVYTVLTDIVLPPEKIRELKRSIQKKLDNYPRRFLRSADRADTRG